MGTQMIASYRDEEAHSKTITLFQDYEDNLRFAEQDKDEALQNSIDWVLRDKPDAVRADVYAKVKELWDNCPLEGRFVYTKQILNGAL